MSAAADVHAVSQPRQSDSSTSVWIKAEITLGVRSSCCQSDGMGVGKESRKDFILISSIELTMTPIHTGRHITSCSSLALLLLPL